MPKDLAKGVRGRLVEFSLALCILTLMLDSGGEIGLRNFGFIILLGMCVRDPTFVIDQRLFCGWIILVGLLVPSILRSAFAGVDLKNILIWVYPFLFFPIIYLVARASRLSVDPFVNAGLFFGMIIVALFWGRVTGDERLMWLNERLTSGASGFFNQKQVYLDSAMPVVYFQGTLSLVFVSVLAFGRKQYVHYLIMLLALILAPSRFGVTVSLIAAYVIFVFGLRSTKWRIVWSLIPFFGVLALMPILPDGFVEIFSGSSHGSVVRWGHIRSLGDTVNEDISKILIGSGAGTFFYSAGFGSYTDNIEISQLELFRKFGIFFFLAVIAGFVVLASFLWKKGKREIALAVAAQFVVATSNPVLLTASFLLFLSVAIRETEDFK